MTNPFTASVKWMRSRGLALIGGRWFCDDYCHYRRRRDEIEPGVHKPEDVGARPRKWFTNLVSLKENPDGPTVISLVGVNGVG